MTNFDFLKKYKDFDTFSDTAIVAEEFYPQYLKESVANCQRALEASVKWMFSIDKCLTTWRDPDTVTLSNLMHTYEFKNLLGNNLFYKIDYIRKKGNEVKHNPNTQITKGQSYQCLENLFYFFDYITKLYQNGYEQKRYDQTLLKTTEEVKVEKGINLDNIKIKICDVSYSDLLVKNKDSKEEFSNRREKNKEEYSAPKELSEYATRKIYIDEMLKEAGFILNKDWREEVEIDEMPNISNKGYADYVLYDDSNIPIAIVEAKKTCKSQSEGRKQAKLYADYFEKKYDRRPIIFLTNGFETSIIDNFYQEREVSSIYSKKDLEKIFHLNRTEILNVDINNKITDRYYQKEAINSVIESFNKYRRKCLLVMATGSGKTRTVASLVDVLQKNHWVERMLFLTDRTALITQAKRAFTNYLPDLSLTSLNTGDFDSSARCVFSTYQTMINKIDDLKEDAVKVFTPGYFDLIIIDEAHRSIYKKYKDIFTYFDCLIVGLTATPKSEVNKNTYDEFDLENGIPTYAYELDQAVKDGFLVSYKVNKSTTKFMNEGITYEDLSEDEKDKYEETFMLEDGNVPERLENTKLNEYIFNEDTIKKVLDLLMSKGLKVDYGNKIGKTIIFAENHNHAEAILKVFNKEYSDLKEYAEVIDNRINYAQSLIDDFSDIKKKPQIAISVDMLDTGIDVPEVVNLVFFKKVYSKAKFNQMIGRGTRLCPSLFDGNDKEYFLIFDPCGNFDFFKENPKENDSTLVGSLQSNLFNIEVELICKLQDFKNEGSIYSDLRQKLVEDVFKKISSLDTNSFRVKQHARIFNEFSNILRFNYLNTEDVINLKNEISPLIIAIDEDFAAVHFDYIMYMIEYASLVGKKASRNIKIVKIYVNNIMKISNIPAIQAKTELMNKILTTEYLEKGDINVFEHIRNELRDIMKYYKSTNPLPVTVNFIDEINEKEDDENDAQFISQDFNDYKLKFESYIKEHSDEEAIKKIKENKALNEQDLKQLNKIVNATLGSDEEFKKEYGNENLITLIRSIVGLDMNTAKELFSKFLDENKYNSKQIYFVNQIIEYVVENGLIRNFEILKSAPFNNCGSIIDLFNKNYDDFMEIKNIIENINKKAFLAA